MDKNVRWVGVFSAAFVRVRKREGERREGREGRELRWRIYERPKQAANPSPSSLSPFFRFLSYSDLSTSSIPGPVSPLRHIAPRCAYVKTQFHFSSLCYSNFYRSLFLLLELLPLSPFEFHIVPMVIRLRSSLAIQQFTAARIFRPITIAFHIERTIDVAHKILRPSHLKHYIFILFS